MLCHVVFLSISVVHLVIVILFSFFFQAEDGIRDLVRSRGLGDVYKRQVQVHKGEIMEYLQTTGYLLDMLDCMDLAQMEHR